MLPPPLKTPEHPKIRCQYSDSAIYWQDHRQKQLVSVQVQTDQPTSSHLRRETPPRNAFPAQQPVQKQSLGPSSVSALSSAVQVAPEVELSDEQKHVLEIVKAGRNLFFTGAAGTGKSVLLREIIRQLKTCSTPDQIAVTATTGIAGVNIGGSTIHSWAGIGLGKESGQKLADKIKKSTSKAKQWKAVKNIIQKVLVNGSAGKVVDFLTIAEAVKRNIKIAEMSKSQAGPEEEAPDMELRPLNEDTFRREEKWPLVYFANGLELLCAPTEFTVVGFMGNTEASRLQVPLILAWAMSVHKSQGQTLTRVKVDLGRTFEKGQAYVAISRATTMEHLQIMNFQPGMIMAHPRVIQWHEQWLSEIGEISMFSQEMDFEEAIAHWNDTEDWNDKDEWDDNEDVLPPHFTELIAA
ncbi:hypothetical protein DXG03_004460 [Asterophora parasitica]|uniref:ATP-dependent DNA helicase n=1 Tax=Asterophora parasitica TaxID=117018 RepID=A0A9P7G8J4_9AGAR|nr:hypothetical protein DXG03_004460 [Asterophora parasitica]